MKDEIKIINFSFALPFFRCTKDFTAKKNKFVVVRIEFPMNFIFYIFYPNRKLVAWIVLKFY
jgi:hypothetical protein